MLALEQILEENYLKGVPLCLRWYDKLEELKTICTECNRKATMVIRLDKDSKVVTSGKQILIGGNETYKVLCRKHFNEMTKLLD